MDNVGNVRGRFDHDGPVMIEGSRHLELAVTVVDPAGTPPRVDVVVTAPPGCTFGELRPRLLALTGSADAPVTCGGRVLDDDLPVGVPPLVQGAVLGVGAAEPERPPGGLLELRVAAGPDAGWVHRLRPGEYLVGRAATADIRLDDPDVSRQHARVRVTGDGTVVADLGSTNGTVLAGEPVDRTGRAWRPGQPLRLGTSLLELAVPEARPASVRPDGAGHLLVNRPPRHVSATPSVRLSLPRPPAARDRPPFPWLAMLLPAVAGGALAAVTGSAAYLLFVALSPLLALGTHLSERRFAALARRREQAAHATALTEVRARVDAALEAERTWRHLVSPDLPTLLAAAAGPEPRLWERRPHDGDHFVVRLGLGRVRSRVEVRPHGGGSGGDDEVERPVIDDVPVTTDLAVAGVLGVAGPRRQLLALARGLVAQLAGWHSPRHLSLVVLAARAAADWEWARWLPHVRRAGRVSAGLLVGTDGAQVDRRLAELAALVDARRGRLDGSLGRRWEGPATVVLVDGADLLRGNADLARLLGAGPTVGVHVVCLAPELVSLPAECGSTVELTGDTGTRLRMRTAAGESYDDVVLDGVGARWAHRFARSLAPLLDATPEDTVAALPESARLLDLLAARGVDASDAAALRAGWSAGASSPVVTLGVGPGGEPLALDLAADGPHLLVAGTTGAGKSELLQTLVAGLAVSCSPERLSFLLVDYKGGAAFRDCARLPHTVGLVTDLDADHTERALRSLRAEIRRRERVLRQAGCSDLTAYPAGARPPLPRLVLVVDEFATLAEELPDFLSGLVGIAQRGRSLGVHLVLATQRPAGVVSANIRANTGVRIALRVTDPAESVDVVDVRDAADIDRSTPGRAVVRFGTGELRPMQTARVSAGPVPVSAAPVVRPWPWSAAGDPLPPALAEAPVGPTDLGRITDAAVAAARDLRLPPARRPWLPSLPDVLPLAGLLAGARPGAVPLGRLDRPDHQEQPRYDLPLAGGGHLLVVGGPRSGRTSLLRTITASVASAYDARTVHVYAWDADGGLGALARLPHCGAVVGRGEVERGVELLDRLAALLDERRQLLAAGGLGSVEEQRAAAQAGDRLPWVLLLVDGWEAFTQTFDEVDRGRAVDTVATMLREGAALGLRAVLTGGRALLTNRVGALAGERLLLRLPDPADYALAGVPPRSVPRTMPAGRALVGADATELQVAVLAGAAETGDSPDVGASAQARALAALAEELAVRASSGSAPPPGHQRALRVDPLPVAVPFTEAAALAGPAAAAGWVLVGAGRGGPAGVDLDADGPAFLVAGPGGSGRSTALATMARWTARAGRPVLVVAHRRSPLCHLGEEPGVLACLGPGDGAGLAAQVAAHENLTVVVDDVETIADGPVETVLLDLLRVDRDTSARLVLAGPTAELAVSFRGVAAAARRSRTGLLLGAGEPGEGDVFDLRLPRRPAGPPGRGLLVVRGRVAPVQVAAAGAAAPAGATPSRASAAG